jgi:hypothetical protein
LFLGMIAISSSDDDEVIKRNDCHQWKRAKTESLPDDDMEEWRARMLALLASPERTPHTAAVSDSSASIRDQQAQLLRAQEAEQLRQIQEEERARQERFNNLLDLTNHPDKDTSLAAMEALLQEEEDNQDAQVVHNKAQAAIGLSRQECIHYQHITRFVPGKSYEQMTDILHDKIVAIMSGCRENSYVIGITTDPYRRFYTADFSYRRVLGAAAKAMYILFKCLAKDAKAYETRLIQYCRLCGPPKILNIKNGGDGLSDLNPHECYVYITIRSG